MVEQLRPRVLVINRCLVLNGSDQMLLIRRSGANSTDVGLWELPGGKLDEGEDLAHALEREVFEETGLLVLPTTKLFYTENGIVTRTGADFGLPYIELVGIGKVIGGRVKLSHEHDKSIWITPKRAMEAGEYPMRDDVAKALAVFLAPAPINQALSLINLV